MNGLRTWWDERSKRPLVVAVTALVAAGTLAWAPAEASDDPIAVGRAAATPAYSQTKTLTRTFADADGVEVPQVTNTVTVQADQTKDLRGRQRIRISWTGAQPSGGRASNPYGENGLQQEYPVVVMQCRGVDDPSLPAAKQLSPSTCWTASLAQRSQVTRSPGDALWAKDLHATEADRERVSGIEPFPAEACADADIEGYWTRLTPFVSRKGDVYPACDADTMAPEAAVGAAYPAAELSAFSDENGSGSVQFEVRSDVENESLGCNQKTACSVVVIPINGLSCGRPESPATTADEACRKGGRFLPGSSNFANDGVDKAVSPALWWAPSNWENRFTIPITFGLPPDTCDILDPRAPTGFYGTELLAQAALQWAPAYCLNKKRFKFQHNRTSDAAGFNLMESGGGAAAEVSSKHERDGEDPVGYAATAVTGFGIGYIIDRPDNAGEYTHLRLNARLIAKLMTQSYLGSDLGRGHPGMADNPLALMSDPEFVELNPGLSQNAQEAGASLLSLANESDVIEQLTAYIAEDRDAMAFVDGKADPWGMRVNPSYKKISLPREEWPLLDEFVPKTENTCRQQNPGPYFSQLAAPVTTMRKIAEALLDAWPNVQTRCDYDASTNLYKLGRIDRQSYGSRFMLGLVSLGDAARFGLRVAGLETKPGKFVEPTDGSLAAALRLAERKAAREPLELDQADVARSATAYPGTMVVYTAARLRNLPQEDADKVAQFIRISTTEGQRTGTGNGQLPAGFLPIKKSGVTAALFDSAQDVAEAVEEQKAAPVEPTDTPTTDTGGGGTTDPVTPSAPPSAVAPSASPTAAVPTATVSTAPVAMPATEAISSRAAGGVVPTLLIVGLIGIALASLLRFLAQGPRRR